MPQPTTTSTGKAAVFFLFTAAWIVLALSIGRLSAAFVPAAYAALIAQGITAALLYAGFLRLGSRSVRDLRPLSSIGFVRRPGIAREFGLGAALGWGIALVLVLPAVLTGNTSATVSLTPLSVIRTLVGAATLAAFALVLQLIFAGLPARLLLRIIGPTKTVIAALLVSGAVAVTSLAAQGGSVLFVLLATGLFLTAFLRTRAIWLSLGLQLGWTIPLQLLFGAASPYEPPVYGIVQSDTGGPVWLTGGPFGPESSTFAVLVLIAALIILVRITRDYAWHYTYTPIHGAGHPMDVAPPAEHLREEQRHAAAPVPLVQISTTPSNPIS